MTFNEYTRIEENLENIQDLSYAWKEVREILKKFRGKPKFHEIYNFVENHSPFVFNALKEAKQAVLTDEAAKARNDNEYEIWCWKKDRKEPLSKPINHACEICYRPLDELDEFIKFGAGI
ncbi:MAG: hypothetical protein IJ597_03745 [Synergistaceae bacterium]|nr:hypothetical protein [Synergistaceae bacterium]